MRAALFAAVKAALMVGAPTAVVLLLLVGYRGDEAIVVAAVTGVVALFSFLFVLGVNVYQMHRTEGAPVRFVGHRGRDSMIFITFLLFVFAIVVAVFGR